MEKGGVVVGDLTRIADGNRRRGPARCTARLRVGISPGGDPTAPRSDRGRAARLATTRCK